MKKFFFLAALALLTATAASAQFTYGVKAGANLSTISSIDAAKMKPSLYAGAFGEYQVSDYFGLAAELVYSRQGYGLDLAGNKANMRVNYINLPVLAKLYVLEGLSVDVGPQVGYVIGAKAWNKNGTEDMKDNYNSIDVGAGMGLTYNITGNILVQARYNIGFTDVAKDNDSDTKFKNGVIQVGVGYRF